jgi:hypothetical protein
LNTLTGRALAIALLVGAAACISPRGRLCSETGDPAELSRLSVTADSTLNALRTANDSQAIWLRQYLQAVVDRTATLDQCGHVSTAPDLKTAARLGLNAAALGAPTVERAYRWARRAVALDSADRRTWRTMASAWDQLQVLNKQPQWFATVISCANSAAADGRCVLAPLDTTRVSDPQRVELGLRTLVQQRAMVDSLNRARGRP